MILSLSQLPFKTISSPIGNLAIEQYSENHEAIDSYQIIITTPFNKVDSALIHSISPSIKLIASIGSGVDHIDTDAARQHGMMVTNTPVAKDDTADFTILLMLASARQFVPNLEFLKADRWFSEGNNGIVGTSLQQKTLGIIGSNELSYKVAKRARVFGMHVIYFDENESTQMTQVGATYNDSLHRLLSTADFISLHCPLTKNNHYMINRVAFEQMKPNAILINTSRGALVDEDALINAVREGSIAGAALDVHSNEPKVNQTLLSLNNVIMTPHISANTHYCRQEMIKTMLKNIALYLQDDFENMDRVV